MQESLRMNPWGARWGRERTIYLLLWTCAFIPFNLFHLIWAQELLQTLMITSALKNTPGSLQVSAAQAVGGIYDEHTLPAWGTLTTGPQKHALNLPQKQDYIFVFTLPGDALYPPWVLGPQGQGMFCTLEGGRCVNWWSIPSGCASLGGGWPARTGSVPWRVGNKGHIPVLLSTALNRVKCWPLWAGTLAQSISLIPLLHPHPSLS